MSIRGSDGNTYIKGDTTIGGNTLIDPQGTFDISQGNDMTLTDADDKIADDFVPLVVGVSNGTDTFFKRASLHSGGASGTGNRVSKSLSLHTQASITCGGELHIYSDERIKTNIIDICDNDALIDFRKLKPKKVPRGACLPPAR